MSQGDSAELFDRYTLPKVALTIILGASLLGTWVSTTLTGLSDVGFVLVKWLYFVSLGVLAGGLLWKHAFVRPTDIGDGAGQYCAEMYERFDRIAIVAVGVLSVCGMIVTNEYATVLDQQAFGYGTVLAFLVAVAGVSTLRDRAVEEQFRSSLGVTALLAALALVVLTGVFEATVRGFGPVANGIRVVHLLAFAVWLGGAVWNIFVAVPTGKRRPTIDVVQAAGEQLERFRWAVRFIIPAIFLTGLYQAYDLFGISLQLYTGTLVGMVVLAKLGTIGVLVVIFKLCPMWRACSPIEGVCDLNELGGESVETDSAPPGSEVTTDD
jgi:putative copper resistance protein D